MGVNQSVVRNRIDLVYTSIKRLTEIKRLTLQEFLADPDLFAVSEHHLRRALEAVLDIGRHIAAKEGWGHPQDYRSIFLVLGQHNVLPVEFARQISGMAGYRNRLVHGYAEVTPEEMYALIHRRIGDFGVFCRHILDYLSSMRKP